MNKIVSLCKRRGFVYPGSEIYGGLANSWDYGPLGVALKNNLKRSWWNFFVERRSDMYGIDAALIMNRAVWKASGHEQSFIDVLVECRKCQTRFRADQLNGQKKCLNCGGALTEPRQFNTMLKTFLGPVEDDAAATYLRPETAQGMFVNFKNVLDSVHPKLPFGMAQIGKAFRNEITPGNFIFRTREFEQMEIEYFVYEKDWKKHFTAFHKLMKAWFMSVGIAKKSIHDLEVPDGERAHYSKRTIDLEYNFPFGRDELAGLAYRTDYDLKHHMEQSGVDLRYTDDAGKKVLPHVIEPTFGVDRTFLAVLADVYREETVKDDTRVYLQLPPAIAPYTIAVFPLLANKPELTKMAKMIYDHLKQTFGAVAFDDRGNIGKRYRTQDEIGTPFCITVDFDSLENNDVTVRDRDSMQQERVMIDDLPTYLAKQLK